MVITELHDIADIAGHADVIIFCTNPLGEFWDDWVKEEVGSNPGVANKLLRQLATLKKRYECMHYSAFKDASGIMRLYGLVPTPESGAYSEKQLNMIKNILNAGSKSHRFQQLWDVFGSVFGVIFPDVPTEQPGGLFLSGYISDAERELITKVFQETAYDIFIYVPLKE